MARNPNIQGGSRRAFTLIELMISVALALILLLGVNSVFKMSGDAVGAAQRLSEITRDNRAAQAVLSQDFRNFANDGILVINSYPVGAFLNFNDYQTDKDLSVFSKDRDGNGLETDAVDKMYFADCNNPRVHRVDQLIFMGRGLYRRNTADQPFLTSGTSSGEALIRLEPAALPIIQGTASPLATNYFGPGELLVGAGSAAGFAGTANVQQWQGAFASDWMLAHTVLVCKSIAVNPDAPATGTYPEHYIQRDAFNPPANDFTARNAAPWLSALHWNSPSNDGFFLWDSRYDLVDTSIATLRDEIQSHFNVYTFADGTFVDDWWASLLYTNLTRNASGALQYAFTPQSFRVRANNFLDRKNPSFPSGAFAKTTPAFVSHVSQFIVEYAGDYLSQVNNTQDANYGAILGDSPDGQVDYILDTTVAANPVQRIRWYGLPRDVGGPTGAGGAPEILAGGPGGLNAANLYKMVDVVPLSDILYALKVAGKASTDIAGFERFVPKSNSGRYDNIPFSSSVFPQTNLNNAFRYTCAWGPSQQTQMPKMIRILMKIEDPTGRVQSGQWCEYVFTLQ